MLTSAPEALVKEPKKEIFILKTSFFTLFKNLTTQILRQCYYTWFP
jgi:hypothetical protein